MERDEILKPKVTNKNRKNRVLSGGYDFQTTESLEFEGSKQKEEKPSSDIKLNLLEKSYVPKKNSNPMTQSQGFMSKTYRNPNMNYIMMQPIPNYPYQNYGNNNLSNFYYLYYNGRNTFNNNNFNNNYNVNNEFYQNNYRYPNNNNFNQNFQNNNLQNQQHSNLDVNVTKFTPKKKMDVSAKPLSQKIL